MSELSVRVPYDIRFSAKDRGGKWEPITKTWRMPSQAAFNAVAEEVATYNEAQARRRALTAPTDLGGSMLAIVEKFRVARSKGLKYPALLFYAVGGYRKVKITLAQDNSKNPGCLYVKGDGCYCGKVNTEGSFFASRDLPTDQIGDLKGFLSRFAKDPVGVGAENGKAAGHCCYCGSELADHRSLHAGYGPVCAKHWDLPWGEKSQPVVTEGHGSKEMPESLPPVPAWSEMCRNLGCTDQHKRSIEI